jgi:hypothetical protein
MTELLVGVYLGACAVLTPWLMWQLARIVMGRPRDLGTCTCPICGQPHLTRDAVEPTKDGERITRTW